MKGKGQLDQAHTRSFPIIDGDLEFADWVSEFTDGAMIGYVDAGIYAKLSLREFMGKRMDSLSEQTIYSNTSGLRPEPTFHIRVKGSHTLIRLYPLQGILGVK
jgi:hypothetical protein